MARDIEKARKRARNRYNRNKEACRAQSAEWKRLNPEKVRIGRRERTLKRYGLDAESYDLLLEMQEHKCLLCGQSAADEKKALAVDHDHETGQIRGLLCQNCNKGIGNLKDDPSLLRRAADYVARNRL